MDLSWMFARGVRMKGLEIGEFRTDSGIGRVLSWREHQWKASIRYCLDYCHTMKPTHDEIDARRKGRRCRCLWRADHGRDSDGYGSRESGKEHADGQHPELVSKTSRIGAVVGEDCGVAMGGGGEEGPQA